MNAIFQPCTFDEICDLLEKCQSLQNLSEFGYQDVKFHLQHMIWKLFGLRRQLHMQILLCGKIEFCYQH